MFTTMTDKDFCKRVHAILSGNKLKHNNIKKELEAHFGRSFSAISQRYRRCKRKSIFSTHDEIIVKTAKAMLKKKICCEVLYDLGFKHESYFYKWFRKHTGMNPGFFKQFN
jgi:AraC-like DNA-binding protein